MPNGSKIVPKGNVVNDNFHMEATRWQHERFVEWLRMQLRRGWNAAELARRLQVPSGTISRWMTGERQPSSRSCDLLADVLGVDLDLVLTLAGHRPGPESAAPDDQRAAIIALLERINLTPDRAAGLQGTLTSWLELDREERRG
jgi:transcriptional regulator with XRE-family HTH domain